MDAAKLDNMLTERRTHTLEPGDHVAHLEAELRRRFDTTGRRRMRPWIGLCVVAAGAFAVAGVPLISRISQQVQWGETARRYLVLEQVPERYRSELADKWERGEGALVERIDGQVTVYRTQFTFSDGHTETVRAFAPPDPAKRRELKRLVANGEGEAVGTIRNEQSGFLTYRNRYTLADGEQIIMVDQWPPVNKHDHEGVKSFTDDQILQGAGVVVGQTEDGYVVEYQLPDGRPYTTFMSTPPAHLTPEREAEIAALKSARKGRLIQRFITSAGWAYAVDYELSDGSVFRIGQDHPPLMTDAEWKTQAEEIVGKLEAGVFVEESIMGTDAKPVDVLTVTLDNGETFQVPKACSEEFINGYRP